MQRARATIVARALWPCTVRVVLATSPTPPPLSSGGLDLARFARLHVVPLPPEILQDPRLLHLALERLERELEAIRFGELDFDHGSAVYPGLVAEFDDVLGGRALSALDDVEFDP